jgi:hypothetical protein
MKVGQKYPAIFGFIKEELGRYKVLGGYSSSLRGLLLVTPHLSFLSELSHFEALRSCILPSGLFYLFRNYSTTLKTPFISLDYPQTTKGSLWKLYIAKRSLKEKESIAGMPFIRLSPKILL